MKIELLPAPVNSLPLVSTLLNEYFREIDPSKIVDGLLDYPYLGDYWHEGREIYFIEVDEKTAGCVLVNDWILLRNLGAERSVAEFYVRPEFRRRGVGKEVAHRLFRAAPLSWEIRQSATNLPAVAFWRNVVREFTEGDYVEVEAGPSGAAEIIQFFKGRGHRAPG